MTLPPDVRSSGLAVAQGRGGSASVFCAWRAYISMARALSRMSFTSSTACASAIARHIAS